MSCSREVKPKKSPQPRMEAIGANSTGAPSANRNSKADAACQAPEVPVIASCRGSGEQHAPAATTHSCAAAASSAVDEGNLRLVIRDFDKMTDAVLGPIKEVNSVAWRIMAMTRGHVVNKQGSQKCLGFFLQCCPDSYSESWSCQATAELSLIPQREGFSKFTRKTSHTYTSKENDWGFTCFLTWEEIMDEERGFIKDNSIVLEVLVKAERPKNLLAPEQFKKKLMDYLRLADLQYERGLLDKAIEVNQTALKLCKDRDPNVKQALLAQKEVLIEKKLKQRIESIEKGPSVKEGAGFMSLKQAIAGLPNTGKQAATKLGGRTSGKQDGVTTADKSGNVHSKPKQCVVELQQAKRQKSEIEHALRETRAKIRELQKAKPGTGENQLEAATHEEDVETQTEACSQAKLAEKKCFGLQGLSGRARRRSATVTVYPRRRSRSSDLGENFESVASKQNEGLGANDYTAADDLVISQWQKDQRCKNDALKLRRWKSLPVKPVNKLAVTPLPPYDGFKGLISMAGSSYGKGWASASKTSATMPDFYQVEDHVWKEVLRKMTLLTNGGKQTLILGEDLRPVCGGSDVRQDVEAWLKFIEKGCWKYLHFGKELDGGVEFFSALSEVFREMAEIAGVSDCENDNRISNCIMAIGMSVVYMNGLNTRRLIERLAAMIDSIERHPSSVFSLEIISILKRLVEDMEESRDIPPVQLSNDSAHCEKQSASDLIRGDNDGVTPWEYDLMLETQLNHVEALLQYFDERQRPLITLSQAEKLMECVDVVEANTVKLIEENNRLKEELESTERNCEKSMALMNRMRAALEEGQRKSAKILQEARQKENAMRKREKSLARHERDAERIKELRDKISRQKKEMAERRENRAEELRKAQHELQSSIIRSKELSEKAARLREELLETRKIIDERDAALKRAEAAWISEKNSLQSTLSATTKRARRAEVTFLELKMASGISTLNRSLKIVDHHIATLEIERRRSHSDAQLKELCCLAAEWSSKRSEIASMISSTKEKFQAQIAEINQGKLLAQLPRISVPAPPEMPKLRRARHTLDARKDQPPIPSVGIIGQPFRRKGVRTSSEIADRRAEKRSLCAPHLSYSAAAINEASKRTLGKPSAVEIEISPVWGNEDESTIAIKALDEFLRHSRLSKPPAKYVVLGEANKESYPSVLSDYANSIAVQAGVVQLNSCDEDFVDWRNHAQCATKEGDAETQQKWEHCNGTVATLLKDCVVPQWSTGDTDWVNHNSVPRQGTFLDDLCVHFPEIPREILREASDDVLIRFSCVNRSPTFNEMLNHVSRMITTRQVWNGPNISTVVQQPPPSAFLVQTSAGVAGYVPFSYQTPDGQIPGSPAQVFLPPSCAILNGQLR